MNREQAEQIARKHANAGGSYYEMLTDRCVDAILEAVAIEREACAGVCDHMAESAFGFKAGEYANQCAKAIRARGNE